jgi:hypothetical protein
MGLPLLLPSANYTDNSAVDAITAAGRMTQRCHHIDIPIAYLHQERDKTYSTKLTTTQLMLADSGTKANVPAVFKRFKYWASGHYFLPKPGTDHYIQLDMQFYKIKFIEILSKFSKATAATLRWAICKKVRTDCSTWVAFQTYK